MSWLQLANKAAIVTGAASGIGAAVVRALAAESCGLVLADRDPGALQQLQKELAGSHSVAVQCDVSKSDQVQSLIANADVFARHSSSCSRNRATLLVNCAGITRDNWVSKMSDDEWDQVMDVNLKGTYLTCRHFLDQERMQQSFQESVESKSSFSMSIVNIGSIVSEYGNLGQANYAASKGGVLGLTRALAKESAQRNVRVNAVLPGFIDTPMANAVPDTVKETVILPKIGVGRFGKPEEIADAVAFLLSPRSSYITGEAIRVSGMISL
mmetsp:Transcript_30440/g.87817  ORF Transcript_30440/g.87817 Transcript_30440/m.87817 type:complete len:269 (+) Transcript_30440:194-1000(+)